MPEYAYGNINETPSVHNQVARVINTACDWACNIAKDNSHGYSQGNRWGPDYDCSSLVISAYRAAGLTINANSTHDMLTGFSPELGFKHIPWYSGLQLLRGDILLKPASHTALYVGDGLVVEAHLAENGTIYGTAGDQGYYMYNGQKVNQEEISYGSYDFGRRWDYVIRYGEGIEGGSSIALGSTDFAPNNTTYQSTTSGAIVNPNGNYSGITVYSDVRNGTPNDRHDMTIREICYFSDRGTFVPDETDITISAINYTTLLGNLYDSFAAYYPAGYTTDTSNFTGTIRATLDYFSNHNINPAACAGIAACLFELSGIGTANQGRGICAWEGKYKREMHQRVEDWPTNLTGQLDFLWEDLMLNYKHMMELLNNVPISDNGARQAANRFMVSYRYTDQVQDINTELSRSASAQSRAAGWFNQIIIRSNSPIGTSAAVTIPILSEVPAGNIVTSATRNSTNPTISADAQPTVAIVSSGDAQSNAMAIYTYLRTATGLSKAQACGVIANIQYESSFNPNALGDNGTSYGICQWHAGRWDNMKTWCTNRGYDWRTLEGQIYYLEYDLVSLHASVYNKIIAQPNTAEGAYQAGYDWCYYFEIPANRAENSRIRGNAAKTYFADSRYT